MYLRRVLALLSTWCAVVVVVTAVPPCPGTTVTQHIASRMLVQHHSRQTDRQLASIQDTAIVLHEDASLPDATRHLFARDLALVHDQFTNTCYDNQWHHSLVHRLCEIFDRHNSTIEETCAQRSFPCVCRGWEQLRAACAADVMPWDVCDRLNECNDHPFAGLCATRVKASARRHGRVGTHQKHTTRNRHPNHHQATHARVGSQWRKAIGTTRRSQHPVTRLAPPRGMAKNAHEFVVLTPRDGEIHHAHMRKCTTKRPQGWTVCLLGCNATHVETLTRKFGTGCRIETTMTDARECTFVTQPRAQFDAKQLNADAPWGLYRGERMRVAED